MENPPSYDDICRTERESRPQHVTLTLVLPSSPEDASEEGQQTEGKEEDSSNLVPPPYDTPSEPPPKYSEVPDETKAGGTGLLSDETAKENSQLGADMIFTLSFVIAFIFNWIGFMFAYCLSMSMAGRYGALSGFGASMVKWSFIAMHSQCCTEYMKNAACLLVALIACGFVIFLRGIYLHIKFKNQMKRGETEDRPVQILYHQM